MKKIQGQKWMVLLCVLSFWTLFWVGCSSDDATDQPDGDISLSDTHGGSKDDAGTPDGESDAHMPGDHEDVAEGTDAASADTTAEDAATPDAELSDSGPSDSEESDSEESDSVDQDTSTDDALAGEDADTQSGEPSWSTEPGRELIEPLYGVTSEGVASLRDLGESLRRHSRRPTTRVVFQQGTSPRDYSQTVSTLREHSYIMGEILDSTALAGMSTDAYARRTRQFIEEFGENIDIWEIGNELNGEWAGTPDQLNAKVLAAWRVVHEEYAHLNLRSAVTLNYWPSHDCYARSWEATLDFAENMPQEVRNGTDYLLLSFYETACDPRAQPTVDEVEAVFQRLKSLFPNSKIGFGEVGAQGSSDGFPDPSFSEKQTIARRYYGMHAELRARLGERYIGGYFWWYYDQDAVPWNRSSSLWDTLDDLFLSY